MMPVNDFLFFPTPLHDPTAGLPAGWTDACETSVHCENFSEMFPDAVIHKKNKKEPPCVPKSFDLPFMMYQSPNAARKASCQWFHCFLALLDSSLA